METDEKIIREIEEYFFMDETQGNMSSPQVVLSEHFLANINGPKLTFQSSGKHCRACCSRQVQNWWKKSNSSSNAQPMHRKHAQ